MRVRVRKSEKERALIFAPAIIPVLTYVCMHVREGTLQGKIKEREKRDREIEEREERERQKTERRACESGEPCREKYGKER